MYGLLRTLDKGHPVNAELGVVLYPGDGVPNGCGPMSGLSVGWLATKRIPKRPVKD